MTRRARPEPVRSSTSTSPHPSPAGDCTHPTSCPGSGPAQTEPARPQQQRYPSHVPEAGGHPTAEPLHAGPAQHSRYLPLVLTPAGTGPGPSCCSTSPPTGSATPPRPRPGPPTPPARRIRPRPHRRPQRHRRRVTPDPPPTFHVTFLLPRAIRPSSVGLANFPWLAAERAHYEPGRSRGLAVRVARPVAPAASS